MFAELNTTFASIDWGVDTKSMEFRKCSEIPEKTDFKIKGVFITPDNGYGEGAVAILDEFLLNLPQRYVEIVKSILSTEEMVEAIKAGKCAINIESFDSKKYKRKGYQINFIDC